MNMQETTELLRIWQSWLGSCRDACDVDGQILWDRIDTALAAAPTPPAQEGYSKEWCLRKAELEGDQEIGAGRDSLIPPAQEDALEDARNDEREGIACFLEAMGHHKLASQIFAGITRPIDEAKRNAIIAAKSRIAARNAEQCKCMEAAPFTSNTATYGYPCDTAIKSPAQEDEPVAWTGQDGNIEPISNRLRRSRPDLYKHYTIPLSYIRPADDELRKAAEEFFAAYDSENADPNEVAKYLENLRAALAGK